MRIAFIVGGFPKLSEPWILSQITGLIDLGHHVDIYARRHPREAIEHPEVADYRLLERTRHVELVTTRSGRLLRTALAFVRILLRHPAAIVQCLNLRRRRSLYFALNSLVHVDMFLRRRYDVFFCHFGGNGIEFSILKEAFPNTRFVTMFHGDDYAIGEDEGPEAFAVLRELADTIIVTSDCYGRPTLRQAGFSEAKMVTHRYGIPVRKIPFRVRTRRPGELAIISVARLDRRKGLDTGIRAVAALRAQNPHVKITYRIIGEGPLRAPLTALIDELDAGGAVQLLGALPRPDVLQWMRDSDLYFLPSNMEEFGVVLLEAQATGLPVVATRVGGVPEAVHEGHSAILIPKGDPAAATEALQRLLDDHDRWPAMGTAGRRHVEEHHDTDALNARLAQILQG